MSLYGNLYLLFYCPAIVTLMGMKKHLNFRFKKKGEKEEFDYVIKASRSFCFKGYTLLIKIILPI